MSEEGDANLLTFIVIENENFLIEEEDYDWQDWEQRQRTRARSFRVRRVRHRRRGKRR